MKKPVSGVITNSLGVQSLVYKDNIIIPDLANTCMGQANIEHAKARIDSAIASKKRKRLETVRKEANNYSGAYKCKGEYQTSPQREIFISRTGSPKTVRTGKQPVILYKRK
jgi:hypothetical protein